MSLSELHSATPLIFSPLWFTMPVIMTSTVESLNICVIHGRTDLEAHFRSQGHTVLSLRPESFLFNLPKALAKEGFAPDMVLQLERLGQRTLLSGLDKVDCVKAFWSIDTHLNHFWHRWYGQLFDLVFTTQRAWKGRLERSGITRAEWLPWYGTNRPLVPHPRRERDVAFVGRVTKHRPVRRWFAEFLSQEYGVEPVEDLTFAQMMDYYSTSRLVPNETIFGEVNFRLFEGASCGCAILNPNISDELADLFEPGVEIDLFDHVMDLKSLMEQHKKDPMRCMKMGVAAWERVQREHLAHHRAERILQIVPTAERTSACGGDARKAFSMTLFSLWEAGRTDLDENYLLGLLQEFGDDPDILGARLRTFAFLGRDEDMKELVEAVMRLGQAGNLRLDALCSAASLRLGLWDAAKIFWFRYVDSLGGKIAPKPEAPAQLLRLWAREMQREGESMRIGFVLQEQRHLPASASECLLTALELDGEDLRTYMRLAQLMGDVHGAESPQMGFLSHLAMHEPDNWRTSLDLAMTSLKAFRMREGLAELLAARDKADQAGQTDRFMRILSARDRGGLLVKVLSD